MLMTIFIIGLSFSFIYLPPVGPTFSEMQNIFYSLAASGSPAVLPFPWAALTPSAHTLKARVGSTSNGNFRMTVSIEDVLDEGVRATAAWSHS